MILRELGDNQAPYRVIVPRWSHAPTSGAGAAMVGGRFNRRGLEALYLSRSIETAVAEYRQSSKLLAPGTIATFLVAKLRVVDFSEGFVAGAWNPIWSRYAINWRKIALEERAEPATWVMGDLALEAGANGILFPSLADPGGVNLVIYNSSALSPEQLRVHDPRLDLPRNAISWELA